MVRRYFVVFQFLRSARIGHGANGPAGALDTFCYPIVRHWNAQAPRVLLREGESDVCASPGKKNPDLYCNRCWRGAERGSGAVPNRISAAATKRQSSAWRETYGCPPPNCARRPGRGRRQRIFCCAGWPILTSIRKKSRALNRRHSAICNASAPCANRIGDVHGISHVVLRRPCGIGIVPTLARWPH
jgi:hypothetical protein